MCFKRLMRLSALLLGVCSVFQRASVVTALPAGNWQLVWSDEFDGTTLDRSKWTPDITCWGGGNNERQCYVDNPENIYVQNGALNLKAKYMPGGYMGMPTTSGLVRSNRAVGGNWLYGYYEVRARMPRGNFLWPAIWMLPQTNTYGGWAASGEIDIFEYRGQADVRRNGGQTLHFGSMWPNNVWESTGELTFPADLSADFHVYSVQWSRDLLQFYVDGVPTKSWNLANRNFYGGNGPNPYTATRQPFDKPFYMILNTAVAGGYFDPNRFGTFNPPADTQTWTQPALQIDYVRIYQPSATPVSPSSSPIPKPSASSSTVAKPSASSSTVAKPSASSSTVAKPSASSSTPPRMCVLPSQDPPASPTPNPASPTPNPASPTPNPPSPSPAPDSDLFCGNPVLGCLHYIKAPNAISGAAGSSLQFTAAVLTTEHAIDLMASLVQDQTFTYYGGATITVQPSAEWQYIDVTITHPAALPTNNMRIDAMLVPVGGIWSDRWVLLVHPVIVGDEVEPIPQEPIPQEPIPQEPIPQEPVPQEPVPQCANPAEGCMVVGNLPDAIPSAAGSSFKYTVSVMTTQKAIDLMASVVEDSSNNYYGGGRVTVQPSANWQTVTITVNILDRRLPGGMRLDTMLVPVGGDWFDRWTLQQDLIAISPETIARKLIKRFVRDTRPRLLDTPKAAAEDQRE